jgi:small subunit ribosomal protein S16
LYYLKVKVKKIMLKIRLKRLGRKKRAFYKIVLMKSLSKRNGKSIEDLGYYDPFSKLLKINKHKVVHYINCGAYPTDTVRHLLLKSIFQNF